MKASFGCEVPPHDINNRSIKRSAALLNREELAVTAAERWREHIVQRVTCVLQHRVDLCAHLPLPIKSSELSVFHAASVSRTSLTDYVHRMVQYADPSAESFVVALLWMERMARAHTVYSPSPYSIHRMLLTCVLVATKMFDDLRCANNERFAAIGGVTVRELNYLESCLLRILQYQLLVEPQMFADAYRRLCDATVHVPVTCACDLDYDDSEFDPLDPYQTFQVVLANEADNGFSKTHPGLLLRLPSADIEHNEDEAILPSTRGPTPTPREVTRTASAEHVCDATEDADDEDDTNRLDEERQEEDESCVYAETAEANSVMQDEEHALGCPCLETDSIAEAILQEQH